MVTEQAILLYFQGQCTAEDAVTIESYLEQHPDVLEKYMGEAEWDRFEAAQTLHARLTNKYWRKIRQATAPASPVVSLHFRRMAIAASILLAVGLSYLLIFDKKARHPQAAEEVVAGIKKVFNHTGTAMLLYLSDSSQVELLPNSELSYPATFTAAKREVTLKGAATFSVEKDSTRAFIVQTDSLLTEVLGTRFTINAFLNEHQIKVALHEGRVRMKTIGMPFSSNRTEYILKPGDTFLFDKRSRKVNISHLNVTVNSGDSARPMSPAKDKKGRSGDNWYMFNNQSLTEVFKQLQLIYNTPIHYRPEDLKGMTFIGKIDRTDSLGSILTAIATLNELYLLKDEQGFTIKK